MSTEPRASARRPHLRLLRRAAARQRLCRRTGADDLVPRRDRVARAAQTSTTSGKRLWPRSPRHPSAARPSTGCSTCTSAAARPSSMSMTARTTRLSGSRKRAAANEEPLFSDEANESGLSCDAHRGAGRAPLCPALDHRCAAPPGARGAAAPAEAARPSPHARPPRAVCRSCAAPCATASAATARSCGSGT